MDSVQDDIPSDQPQDKDEDCILALSTVIVAKKIKELIKKDKMTIADLEGVVLEMLKSRYKNDVELEYHVDKIKAAMLEEVYMEKKYTSSLAKHYAARYYIEGIKDMISDRWSKEVQLYYVDALNDNKEYEFSYADLSRLNLNDIEDMYLLKVQGKIHHLKIEDTQLGVESYQRTLNLTKPKFYISRIKHKISYTMTGTEKGVVYLNKYHVKSLMLHEEVHKFCDGTLMKLKGRERTKNDIKRSKAMPKATEKTLKHREQLRTLEEYVGGTSKAIDIRSFVRP
ncbi:hypothetical protein Tco_0034062 [Tanacetum coccineum]